jgi:hypothetical protein
VANNAIIKRIEALEGELSPPSTVTLINVWTRTLAEKIQARLPKGKNIRLVHLTFKDAQAEQEWEALLRKDNPSEAKRIDALLRGEIPR